MIGGVDAQLGKRFEHDGVRGVTGRAAGGTGLVTAAGGLPEQALRHQRAPAVRNADEERTHGRMVPRA
ncbi:MAG TPA: hypothetical protein VGH35_02485 [Gaiellaceae bacterium]